MNNSICVTWSWSSCICLAAKSPVAVQLLKLNVDVLCVAPSHLSVVEAATSLVVPAICDQLSLMSKMAKKNASQDSKVQLYYLWLIWWWNKHPHAFEYSLLAVFIAHLGRAIPLKVGFRKDGVEVKHAKNCFWWKQFVLNLWMWRICVQISAFHFCPLSCPITVIYDLSYGENETALGKVFTLTRKYCQNKKQHLLCTIHVIISFDDYVGG